MRTVLLTRQAVAVAAVAGLGVLGISAPAIASAAAANDNAPQHAARTRPLTRPALPAGQRYVCPPAGPGQMTCMSIVKTASRLTAAALTAKATPAAQRPYLPADLRKAYKIATAAANSGGGRTVAIVDAFSDPHASADLAVYRHTFHLPACTTSNGCLKILNQRGKGSPLPLANANWAFEESLDLDMVSAICPKCHILLIEATNSSDVNLGTAENTAIARGAKYVSNSWSSNGESSSQSALNHFFNHPGHVIAFASGDFGYGPNYPADLQYVTSVGGTSLRHASNGRGWTESVWGTSANTSGTGSGCSAFQAKPSWQLADANRANGCKNRTLNDVAAVADPNTGVAIYDSYRAPSGPGFYQVGGTSASTPIITGIYALAGAPVVNTYPAEYPYLHARNLFDVTSGANGNCGTAQAYLCHGIRGFDGPTGLGTPNGTTAFGLRPVRRITLVDPGTQTRGAGTAFSLKITGLDTRKVSSLHFVESGLPAGLSIHAILHSTNGLISGRLPSAPGTFHVTITGKDGSASGTTHFTIVVS